MKKLAASLMKSTVFLGKEREEIEKILVKTKYKIRNYKKNDLLFSTHHVASFIGIVLKGSVIIQINLATGKAINNVLKERGDSFGGVAIFSDISTYPCDIVAKENCSILLIPVKCMRQLISYDRDINFNVVSAMSKNMVILNKKTELLSYSSIQEKISFFLLENVKSENEDTVKLPYSKKLWAEFLNVSRPSLYRELNKLIEERAIEINKSSIKILDIGILESKL